MKIMNRFLVSITLLLLTIAPVGCQSDKHISNADNAGYKGIYVGQRETELPKWLKNPEVPKWVEYKLPFYEGIYEGDGFKIFILDGRVHDIEIIYSGKMSFTETTVNKSVTLADALKEHTISRTTTPVFAFAKGRDDSIHGLVDLTNHIVFDTPQPTDPYSQVSRVGYINKDAPVLFTGSKNKLSDEQASKLIAAANSSKGGRVKRVNQLDRIGVFVRLLTTPFSFSC